MPRKKKTARTPMLYVEGRDLSYPLGQTFAIELLRPMLHFDERGTGEVEIRYSNGLVEDINTLTGLTFTRHEDQPLYHQSVMLEGTGVSLQLSQIRRLPLDHFYFHLDQLQNGTWRLAWGKEVIPEIQEVLGLRIQGV